jgi:hypothetical protein
MSGALATALSTAFKPATSETTGERDLLLAALRVASARSKLIAVELDSIGVSLRHKAVNCEQALTWAAEEGLLDWIPLGREVVDG